jgi:hypothetical protein
MPSQRHRHRHGIRHASGWLGLVVSSPIIGAIAGKDNRNIGTALLLLPASSVAMVLVNLIGLRTALAPPQTVR